jgi:hypothetical protein
MKKLLAIILCFGLLAGIPVFAAAEIDDDGFVFRNGIRWGMSPEEVEKAMEEPVNYAPDGDSEILRVPFPAVSNFKADMLYLVFESSSLYAAFYEFDYENPSLYLKRALSSLYGESERDAEVTAEFAAVLAESPAIVPAGDSVVSLGQWMTEDNTHILLAAVGDIWMLGYYNLDYWAPELNTEGL